VVESTEQMLTYLLNSKLQITERFIVTKAHGTRPRLGARESAISLEACGLHDGGTSKRTQKEYTMFKRNDDTETASVRLASESAGRAPVKSGARSVSVIGPTLVFKGELSADEDLIIEGTIEGTIAHQQKNLTVGKQGRVKANIHAKSVTIEGSVQGDVRGDEFVLLSPGANVSGNLSSPRIQMSDGAVFNGRVEMSTRQPELSVAKPAPRERSISS
jgi:cytoskeletal protein CcmA (bactofilin family)